MQRVVAILGAPRSGTSVLAKALQTLGVELGADFRQPTAQNPRGFFEDRHVFRVNSTLVNRLNLPKRRILLVEPEVWQQPSILELQARSAEELAARFREVPLWGFKDARTLRFLPFWLGVFERMNVKASFAVAVRNPLSVIHSRAEVNQRKWAARSFTFDRYELEWLVYTVPFLSLLSTRQFIVVDFDRMMADPTRELIRLAWGLELPVGPTQRRRLASFERGFLDARLRHNAFTPQDLVESRRLSCLTRRAYELLHGLSAEEWAREDPAFWNEWGDVETMLASMAPALRYASYLEEKLRLSQWNPLSPLQLLLQRRRAATW